MTEAERLTRLLARLDELNSQDPTHDVVAGVRTPRELAYARRLSDWVLRLEPAASEALRIAARGQHVQRWTIPRDRYPRTRKGYLQWREALKRFHIDTVAGLMRELGYPDATIERVGVLMSKRQLSEDRDTQRLEDALCLVFLETQFADLRKKEPPEKMVDILRKTWRKMSPAGREAAKAIPLDEAERRLLEEALRGA